MRQYLSASLLVVAAVATTLAVAAPANASYSGVSNLYMSGDPDCPDNLRARGTFVHTTDNVRSADECADGWGSDAVIRIGNGPEMRCYNESGNGTTRVCNRDHAENVNGTILVQVLNNGDFKGSGTLGYFET